MSESIFEREGDDWLPTAAAMGPWGEALHGGAPSGLLAHALEARAPEGFALQRFTIDLYRPAPRAPLQVEVRPLREGRRICVLEAVLKADGRDVARAVSLHTAEAGDLPVPPATPIRRLADAPAPEPLMGEARSRGIRPGLYSHLLVRRLEGEPGSGRGLAWLHMPLPLAPDVALTPISHLAVLADFANGLAQRRIATGDGEVGFINADISMHVLRAPASAWVCMDAHNVYGSDGRGMVHALCHDEHGEVARISQAVLAMGRG